VAAYHEGEAWLDQLLRPLDYRRAVLGTLLAERLPGARQLTTGTGQSKTVR